MLGTILSQQGRTDYLPMHGYFSSADARAVTLDEAGARIPMYLDNGSTDVVVLGTSDQVIITHVQTASVTGAQTIAVYDGSDDTAGADNIITFSRHAAAIGNNPQTFLTPHYCQVGTYPKVEAAAAGQLEVTIRGYIKRV